MARQPRKRSSTGIYHVMVRGNNKMSIFEETGDYSRFLKIIYIVMEDVEFEIHGYCMMYNHVHLLIKDKEDNISDVMKRINLRYAMWYNYKYNRIGHFFQGRFKSEPVENEGYYATVLRYIHQNPIKAGLTDNNLSYRWSSYKLYKRAYNRNRVSINFNTAMSYWKTWHSFDDFMHQQNVDKCLELCPAEIMNDEELKGLIKKRFNTEHLYCRSSIERNKLIRDIFRETGASRNRLAQILDINPNIIHRACIK